MKESIGQKLTRLLWLLKAATPDSTAVVQRSLPLERNIAVPARGVVLLILYHSFFFSPWIGWVSTSLEVGVETVTSLYWIYAGASVAMSCLLLLARRLPTIVIRWTMVMMWLSDAVFLAGLTLITGGYDSFAYWLFVVLIVRAALMEPASVTQLIVSLFTSGCYLIAGLTDFALAESLKAESRSMLGLNPAGHPGEVLFVRTLLLLLVALCGYGVQLLLDRQRRADAEMQEYESRESQLRSTGRLAAEIAHQLKNPLAIINNTTYSLQRARAPNPEQTAKFVGIIREEIERADRILTQVMGYARLAEGRVEKLNVVKMLDDTIVEVIPSGSAFKVQVEQAYGVGIPPLMMQREHLREVLVNLLTNARDALAEGGRIRVTARPAEGGKVEIRIEDSGPGIPADQQRRIFEAYYTTKPKGTGLGLAIVKNNIELYGGTVQVESELGKGTRFILSLPTRLSNPSKA